MDWDDLKPKPKKGVTLGEDLTTLSVAELEARIGELQQEIERVQGRARRQEGARSRRRPDLQAVSAGGQTLGTRLSTNHDSSRRVRPHSSPSP